MSVLGSDLFGGYNYTGKVIWNRDPITLYRSLFDWFRNHSKSSASALGSAEDSSSASLAEQAGVTSGSSISDAVGTGAGEDVPNWFQGLLTSFGQEQAIDREYNAEQAGLSRQWSEMMSNTSYQRAVTDLKAAGLNPILAVTGGGLQGAVTPSSATAQHSANGGDSLSDLITSIAQLTGSVADVMDVFVPNVSKVSSNSISRSENHNFNYKGD